MAQEYIIPIGIDSNKLFKNFKDTIEGLEQVESKSGEVGKAMNEAFERGSRASEQFESKIKPVTKSLESIRDLGKIAGRELAEAFNAKSVNSSEFDKKIDSFRNKLSSLTSNVDIQIDDAKLIIFQREIENAKDDVEGLNVALRIAKEVMSTMDTNSEEYQQLSEAVTFTESALSQFGNEVVGNVEKSKTLKSELRQLNNELQQMEMNGEGGSQRFLEMSIRAGELRDQIGDTQAQINVLASDTKYFDGLISGATGLVGGFTAVQGAAALFGDENEELNEALLKVNGAMAVLQGLQAVSEVLNKDSAFSIIFLRGAHLQNTAATVADSAATAANTAATAALVAAEATLAAAVAAETEAQIVATAAVQARVAANTAETATAEAAALATLAQAQAARQLAAAEVQTTTAAAANTTAQGAQAVAMGASTIAANILGFALKAIGIGLIILAVAALVEYWDELKDAMKSLLPVGTDIGKTFDKIKSYAFGVGEAILKFVVAPFKAAYLAATGDFKGAIDAAKSGFDVVSNFQQGVNRQNLRNQQKYLDEKEAKDIESSKRDLERRRNRGEDTYKEEQKLFQREISLKKRTREETEEVQKQMEDAQDKRTAENNKKAEDARKKAEEKRKKLQEEAEKRQKEEAKKNAELTLKYGDELSKIQLENEESNLENRLKIIDNEAKLKIEAIEREGASSAKAIEKKEALIAEIQKQAEANKNEIIKEALQEKYQLQADADRQLTDLKKEGLDKEIDLLRINTQEQLDAITERYAKDEATRTRLTEAVQANMSKKEIELKNKYAIEALKTDEEKAILGVELASAYAKKTEETERQKQIALLRVRLEYAIKNLSLIIDDGTEEAKVRKLNAEKAVAEAQEGVDNAIKKNKGKDFDFLDFLGIGEGMTQEDRQKLRGAINESMEVLKDFTSFMIDNYQEQIDAKNEQVEQTQSEIEDLEDKLDNEKDLREQGLANNVEVIEAEIAEKERQKNEQIKQEEELLEKKKAMQKVQLALDTVTQLSGLITASVNIFQGFSTIPIVGIPLAIAMIGLMFGTFVASKAKAAQSINAQTVQHAEGGEISGRSHGQGGEKYYNKDGSKVKELEDGEFVIKKRQYRKFDKLVRAINDNDFSRLNVNDYAVAEVFRGMGFDFDTGIQDVKNLQVTLMTMGYSANESEHLADISKGIAILVESDRNTPKSWSDGVYNWMKVGNTKTKTPINSKIEKDEN